MASKPLHSLQHDRKRGIQYRIPKREARSNSCGHCVIVDVVGDVVDFEHVCVFVWDLWGDVVVSAVLGLWRKEEVAKREEMADGWIVAQWARSRYCCFR